jgi:hypothetical protein
MQNPLTGPMSARRAVLVGSLVALFWTIVFRVWLGQ